MRMVRHGRISYADSGPTGDAAPIVLLHGLGNSAYFWHLVFPIIGKTRRVVALDIPGFGSSDTPDAGLSLGSVADDIVDFLYAMDLSTSVVCGHSMGGIVALAVGRRSPQISEIVLVDGHLLSAIEAIRHLPSALVTDFALTAAVSAQFLAGLMPLPNRVLRSIVSNRSVRRVVLLPFVADPGQLDARVLTDALRGSGGLNVARAFCIARETDLARLMSGAQQGVSLIWGSSDRLLRAKDHIRAHELMTVVDTLELEGVGHWPMLEAPELLASALANYHPHAGFQLTTDD